MLFLAACWACYAVFAGALAWYLFPARSPLLQEEHREEKVTPLQDDASSHSSSACEVEDSAVATSPSFPFLKITNLVPGGTPSSFLPNTRAPIPFDCPTCSGEMLVMLRTNPIDEHFAWAFDKKKRYFDLHFSLKLKQTPKSVLYLGGEVPRKMNLGFVSNLACRGILSVIRKLASTGHYSMGGKEELPHIVFPLWHAADRLVVTREGGQQRAPAIGQGAIPEPDEARERRFKDASLGRGQLKAGDTITFSFHSAYIDLVEWKVKGLGAIGDQSLRMFWDTMPLRVAVYDMDSKAKQHVDVDYYLLFELENTWMDGRQKQKQEQQRQEEEEEEGDGDTEVSGGEEGSTPFYNTVLPPSSSPSSTPTTPSTPTTAQTRKRNKFLSSIRSSPFRRLLPAINSSSSAATATATPPSPLRRMSGFPRGNASTTTTTAAALDPPSHISLAPFPVALAPSTTATTKVPFFLELDTLAFAVLCAKKREMLVFSWDAMLRMVPSATWRLSGSFPSTVWEREMARRVFQEEIALRGGVVTTTTATTAEGRTSYNAFARAPIPMSKRFVGPSVGQIQLETFILHQVSEHRLVQEYLVVMQAASVFFLFFQSGKRQPVRILDASKLLAKRAIVTEEGEEAGLGFALQIETTMREYTLLFSSRALRDSALHWLADSAPRAPPPDVYAARMETALVVQKCAHAWPGGKDRVVLNTRRLARKAGGMMENPNAHVESALRLAARLVAEEESGQDTTLLLVRFLDMVSELRAFDIIAWSTHKATTLQQRTALLLNLYHLLLLHARFLFGAAGTSGSRSAYKTASREMSYEFGMFGDDERCACVLSLAEVEMLILHAFPIHTTMSNFAAPTHTLATLALKLNISDARICFAINRLCKSNLARLFVFTPENLDCTLAQCAAEYLDMFLLCQTKRRGCTVLVPAVVKWFARDFGSSARAGGNSADARSMMGALLPHVSNEKSSELAQLVTTSNGPSSSSSLSLAANGGDAGGEERVRFEYYAYDWTPRSFHGHSCARLELV